MFDNGDLAYTCPYSRCNPGCSVNQHSPFFIVKHDPEQPDYRLIYALGHRFTVWINIDVIYLRRALWTFVGLAPMECHER
jgi:hypothetical protein